MARQYTPATKARGFNAVQVSNTGIARLEEESNRILQNLQAQRNADLENRRRILEEMRSNANYTQTALDRNFRIASTNETERQKQIQYDEAERRRRFEEASKGAGDTFKALSSLSFTAAAKWKELSDELGEEEYDAGIDDGIANAGLYTTKDILYLEGLDRQGMLSSLVENDALLAKEKGYDPNSIAKLLNMTAKQRAGFLYGAIKQQTKTGYPGFLERELANPENTFVFNGEEIPYSAALEDPAKLAVVQAILQKRWVKEQGFPDNHELLKGAYQEIKAHHNTGITTASANQTKFLNEDTLRTWDNAVFSDPTNVNLIGQAYVLRRRLEGVDAANAWWKNLVTLQNPDGSFVVDDAIWQNVDTYGTGKGYKGRFGQFALDFKGRTLEFQNLREDKRREWERNQASTDRIEYRQESKAWWKEYQNNPTAETLAAAEESFSDNMEGPPEWISRAKQGLEGGKYISDLLKTAKDLEQRGILTQSIVTEVFGYNPKEGNRLQEALDKQNPFNKSEVFKDNRKIVTGLTKKASATVMFPQDSADSAHAGRMLAREYDARVKTLATEYGGDLAAIERASTQAAKELEEKIAKDSTNPKGTYYREYNPITGLFSFPNLKEDNLTPSQAAKEQAIQFQTALKEGRRQELINTKFGVLTEAELTKELENFNKPGYTPNVKLVLASQGVDGGLPAVLRHQAKKAGPEFAKLAEDLDLPESLQRVAAYSPSAQKLLTRYLNAEISTRIHGYEGGKLAVEWNRHIVPAQHRDSVELHAKELNQSPAILSAVLEQSGWNPNARLPSGRAGIGLLSPEMARARGIDLSNPDSSIKGVAEYMNVYTAAFGDPIMAAGALHSSPEVMQAYLEGRAELPAETVNYMRKVAKAYYKYSGDARILRRPEVIRAGMMLPAGVVVPFERDPLPSTGDHLDTRILVMSGPNKGQRIDPSTRPDLLNKIYIGNTPEDAVPLTTFSQSSGYGPRTAPAPGASTFHQGIDWRIRSGQKIFVKDGERYYREKGAGVVPITDDDGNKFELELYHTED